MKRRMVLFLIVLLGLGLLCGCNQLGLEVPDFSVESAVQEENKVYHIGGNIESLEIQIGAANVFVKQADRFYVESNLKYLTVTEQSGLLKIQEERKLAVGDKTAMLTVYIPAGIRFESVRIISGAAKLTADILEADNVKLELGAGDAQFGLLNAFERAEISGGGAGKITVSSGTLQDLELDMGVGALDLTVALRGNSELSLGVGTSKVLLLGDPDAYTLDVEKGTGVVKVCGEKIDDAQRRGNGEHRVDIEGGLGTVEVDFQN